MVSIIYFWVWFQKLLVILVLFCHVDALMENWMLWVCWKQLFNHLKGINLRPLSTAMEKSKKYTLWSDVVGLKRNILWRMLPVILLVSHLFLPYNIDTVQWFRVSAKLSRHCNESALNFLLQKQAGTIWEVRSWG